MTISRQLVERCHRPVAPDAHRRAVNHVIDWLGCAAIGASSPGAEALWQGSALPSKRNMQTAAGDSSSEIQPDPWRDVLYEASLGNIYEMDDVHRMALVHPGSVVVPTALFLGRQLGASGSDILSAIVRGYEAMIRFGAAVGPQHYAILHNTATCGALGAAATACSILGVKPQQWVDAFGHAVTQAAGLWQVRMEPCMSKQWHVARATQTGIQAALYARAGVTGPTQIFEGEKGYFKAMCPDGDPRLVVAKENDPWAIFATSFKPWPACRHAHAAIDAAIDVRKQLSAAALSKLCAQPDSVDHVQVYSYHDALAFCDNATPDTPLAARFSLQHAVAVVLMHGAPRLEHFETPFLDHPDICDLRAKIRVAEDPLRSERYPRHFSAGVEIAFAGGTTHRASVEDAWGDPERPMSNAQVHEKARTLCLAAGWDDAVIHTQLGACSALFEEPQQVAAILPIRQHTAVLNATVG